MNLSKIMQTAHAAMKQSNYTAEFSHCLIGAWNKERARMEKRNAIIQKLKSGIVAFRYTKKDGTVRLAIGTLDKQFINYTSKGTGSKENVEYVRYFDLTKNEYRMFLLDNFIEFVPVESVGAILAMVLSPSQKVVVDLENNYEYLEVIVPCDEFGNDDIYTPEISAGIEMFKMQDLKSNIDDFVLACYNTKIF